MRGQLSDTRHSMSNDIWSYAPGKARDNVMVSVEADDELNLQTVALRDLIMEGNHAASELLANMISRSGPGMSPSIEDYGKQGIRLVRTLFEQREPHVAPNLHVEFEIHESEDKRRLVMTFRCKFTPLMSSAIHGNPNAQYRIH